MVDLTSETPDLLTGCSELMAGSVQNFSVVSNCLANGILEVFKKKELVSYGL